LSKPRQISDELKLLEESLNSEIQTVNIRLRKGEYQFDLAKGIASFELELRFPNVKDIIKQLYGKEKTQDIQFIRKIQTILKKMERSGVVRILPKKKPWELQRYALSSFKFQDVEKNLVILATESEIEQTQDLIHSQLTPNSASMPRPSYATVGIWILIFATIISYGTILWALTQPSINLIIFASAFCIAVLCSFLLGISISRRK